MTPELKLHYERLMALFASEGWKEFMEDAMVMIDPLENIRECANLEFRKGQLNLADWIVSYEEANRQAYKELDDL